MRLCASVITYYPDIELLKKNLLAYYDYVEKIIIWQNTIVQKELLKEVDLNEKIVYIGDGHNRGISNALNEIVKYSKQEGFTHLLMMDQDSLFENFDYYFNQVKSFYCKDQNIVQIGPEINESKIPLGQLAECKYVITSGSIIDIDKTIFLNGFRSDFFVDGIDLDFGYKVNKNGGKVCQIGGAVLIQNFGDTYQKGKRKIVSYSPKRLYDTVKTQVILWKEYPNYFHKFLFLKIYFVCMPLNILFYQDDKFNKLKAILKGFIAGMRN